MKWHELEKYWQTRTAGHAAPAWNAADFETRRLRLARSFARRDWLEAGTGLLVAAMFSLPPLLMGPAAWPAWIAVALVLGVTTVFVRERRRARRNAPAPEAPLLMRLEAEIRELEHQRQLLLNVAWWYLFPLLLAIALLVWAVHLALPGQLTTPMIWRLVWFGALMAIMGAVTLWLNHQAVRRTVEPRLSELRSARAALLEH
jgi:O-antigen/teichoic acid export membrane protein